LYVIEAAFRYVGLKTPAIGIDPRVREAGYENYHSPPPSYEQALTEDPNEGELDADLAVAQAFIRLLEWRRLMQPSVRRASWDHRTEHEIDRAAQEIIWRLERGIAVVESRPGVAEVLESVELETPRIVNPSRSSSPPPGSLGEGRGQVYWQSAMDLAELQLDLSIALEQIRILL
jgi:hypothetical protein